VNLRIPPSRRNGSIAERFGALATLRDAGLIRHLGISGREAGARTAEDEAVLEVARARGVSSARVRLAWWTLRQGPHVLAIPGTGDPARLVENVVAGATRLSDDEMARLRSPQQDLA
jgi:pyridoxine 4-dehydrogenase